MTDETRMAQMARMCGDTPDWTSGTSWAGIWFWAILVATLLGWSSVAFVYFGMLAAGKPLTLEASIFAGLPEWYSWAALTPLVFSLGRRFRLERRKCHGDRVGLRALQHLPSSL